MNINFCPYCGCNHLTKFEEYHLKCDACGQPIWIPPKPAAMGIIPTDKGYLFIKRGQGMGIGKWAFPGGFMEKGETPPDTATREIFEETGLRLDASKFEHYGYGKSITGNYVLIFLLYSDMLHAPQPMITSEATDYAYITKSNCNDYEYAFPHHWDMLINIL